MLRRHCRTRSKQCCQCGAPATDAIRFGPDEKLRRVADEDFVIDATTVDLVSPVLPSPCTSACTHIARPTDPARFGPYRSECRLLLSGSPLVD